MLSLPGEVIEEEEEVYDNFDPSRDVYEWSNAFEVLEWKEYDSNSEFVDSSSANTDKFAKFQVDKRYLEGKSYSRYRYLNKFIKCFKRLKCLSNMVKNVINSVKFNIVVIILVVLDCFAIAGEVIFDYIERVFYESRLAEDETRSEFESTTIGALFGSLKSFFKYSNMVILAVLCLEIFIKIVFSPKRITRLIELFDFSLVIFTFGINLYLFNKNDSKNVHSVIGLIILLRLWRINEIINGVFTKVRYKHAQELKRLQEKIFLLESQIELLNHQISNRLS